MSCTWPAKTERTRECCVLCVLEAHTLYVLRPEARLASRRGEARPRILLRLRPELLIIIRRHHRGASAALLLRPRAGAAASRAARRHHQHQRRLLIVDAGRRGRRRGRAVQQARQKAAPRLLHRRRRLFRQLQRRTGRSAGFLAAPRALPVVPALAARALAVAASPSRPAAATPRRRIAVISASGGRVAVAQQKRRDGHTATARQLGGEECSVARALGSLVSALRPAAQHGTRGADAANE